MLQKIMLGEEQGCPISPISCGISWVRELHAPFLNERRTRGRVQGSVQELRGISHVLCARCGCDAEVSRERSGKHFFLGAERSVVGEISVLMLFLGNVFHGFVTASPITLLAEIDMIAPATTTRDNATRRPSTPETDPTTGGPAR